MAHGVIHWLGVFLQHGVLKVGHCGAGVLLLTELHSRVYLHTCTNTWISLAELTTELAGKSSLKVINTLVYSASHAASLGVFRQLVCTLSQIIVLSSSEACSRTSKVKSTKDSFPELLAHGTTCLVLRLSPVVSLLLLLQSFNFFNGVFISFLDVLKF